MMTRLLGKRAEDGATLILVLGFMVMVGMVSAGLATQLASSSKTRVALDAARNREYAADAAILQEIAQVRQNLTNDDAITPCRSPKLVQSPGLNDVDIQVDCSYSLFSLSGLLQRNATFSACAPQPANANCPSAATIIKAQVHYASTDAALDPDIDVTQTYVQSWNLRS
jgi:hypothetical protein